MYQEYNIAFYGPAGSGKDYVAKHLVDLLSYDIEENNFHPYLIFSKPIRDVGCQHLAFAIPVKQNISILLGFNEEEKRKLLYDEKFKNNTYVNLKNMSYTYVNTEEYQNFYNSKEVNKQIFTAKELNDYFHRIYKNASEFSENPSIDEMRGNENIWISLREFLVYYGTYVGQSMISRNVWVNAAFNNLKEISHRCKIEQIPSIVYCTDLRFPHEYKALKKKNFIFIKVNNKEKNIDISNIAESYYDQFKPDYIFENTYNTEEFNKELRNLENFIYDKVNKNKIS